MSQSKSQVYLHFVWATHRRMPLLTDELEREVHRCIESTLREMEVTVLALNGIEDHLHLAIILPTKYSPADIMQKVKGISSTVGRKQKQASDGFFGWQDGYAVFSFRRKDRQTVIDYIKRQKEHHLENNVWSDWEPDEII